MRLPKWLLPAALTAGVVGWALSTRAGGLSGPSGVKAGDWVTVPVAAINSGALPVTLAQLLASEGNPELILQVATNDGTQITGYVVGYYKNGTAVTSGGPFGAGPLAAKTSSVTRVLPSGAPR